MCWETALIGGSPCSAEPGVISHCADGRKPGTEGEVYPRSPSRLISGELQPTRQMSRPRDRDRNPRGGCLSSMRMALLRRSRAVGKAGLQVALEGSSHAQAGAREGNVPGCTVTKLPPPQACPPRSWAAVWAGAGGEGLPLSPRPLPSRMVCRGIRCKGATSASVVSCLLRVTSLKPPASWFVCFWEQE